jgi:GT2 family glycosyltransferase/Flp pilus assembly protein TadD
MISPVQKRLESIKNQAVAKHKQGERKEAIALYLKALQLDENQSDWIYGNVITLLTKIGQIEQGLELAAQALKKHPDSDTIYRAIGLALNQQGNLKSAAEHYLKALEINLHQPDWLYAYLIENFFAQQQFQEAIELGTKGALIYPDCYWINYHLGNSYAALEQWDEALNFYQKAQGKNKKTAELQEKIDFILQKKSFNIKAENVVRYLSAISSNPKNIDAYYKLLYEDYKTVLLLLNLAFNLAENNNFNNAVQYYKQALTLNSRLVDFYLNHQEVFLRQFESQETIVKFQEAANLTIGKRDLLEKPHTSNFLLHQYRQLLAIYHQELESYPHEVEIYLEIANIYGQQNRLIKAISFCQRALKLQPHNINAKLILAQLQQLQTRFYARVQNVVGTTPEYSVWLEKRLPQDADIDWLPEIIDTFGYQPLISIVVSVENIPESYLVEMLESVLLQIYPYWELCLVVAPSIQPQIIEILEEYQIQNSRIKLISRAQTESNAAMANAALVVATGDFVAFLRAGDQLAPTALSEVVELLNLHPKADLVYTDEDQVNEAGQYCAPHFKPNWCPDSMLSRMYTGDLEVYRHSMIQEIGGFQLSYGEAANYDLSLRFTEKTVNIFHLPQILYHRRKIATETIAAFNQTKYSQDHQQAIADALTRRHEQGTVIEHPEIPGIYTVRYQITEYKLVSIIIPTKNLGKVLDQCLQSIFTNSTYPNYEVIIIDNGTDEAESLAVLSQWQAKEPERCFIYRLDIPFNYSKLNNFGAKQAKGDYLLFLNNDIEVITEDWIEGMVEQAQRTSIGAVGAMLLYPDHKIQHGGVILGIRGVASHSHKNFAYGDSGYANQLISINNYSAVTAACLMCRREVFTQVNGFDETLPVTFNDVDFCLKIRHQDYHNVWLPHVVLYHHESQSRGADKTPEEKARFRQEVAQMETRWGTLIAQDPCYNINLTRTAEDYGLLES